MTDQLIAQIREALEIPPGEEPTNFIDLRLEMDRFVSQSDPYTAEHITRIQQIMKDFGYLEGDATGVMDATTANAMLHYTANDSIAFRNGQLGMSFIDTAIEKGFV